MIYGIILAGGKGTRMGTAIPKQYLNLKEKPIIINNLNSETLRIGTPKMQDWMTFCECVALAALLCYTRFDIEQ